MTCDCRKIHDEELKDPYYSPHITYVTKSRTARWVGHIARIVKKKDIQDFGGKKLYSGKPNCRHRRRCGIILEWILEDLEERNGLDLSGSG